MNEMDGKTASSSLAITEKKGQSHRPGGCVGIFFQLFDWNRRFAKKKLFSKKLLPLPSAPTKQHASKKFGGDEKMSKTKSHLIADENSGGLPNLKNNGSRGGGENKEQKLEMRPPGLVARLMGLEAMPAVRDKHKKSANPVACDVKEEKIDNDRNVFDREDVNLEKGNMKVESRPQKLQKTGQFGRRAVMRFEAEGLQIKNVLSRSRKHHHHPKLLSPVKSPRISNSCRISSRASRLIDAAARILEPGLQATSRAKCALSYSTSMNYGPKDELLTGEMEVMSPDTMEQQYYRTRYGADIHKPLMGRTSCKNCGSLLGSVDYRPNEEEQPFVCPSSAQNSVHSSQESENIKPRAPVFSPEQEDVHFKRTLNKLFLAAEKLDNASASIESVADDKPPTRENQEQLPPRNQPCRPRRDEPPSTSFKRRTQQTQNEFSMGRDGTPLRAKSSDLQSRRASSAANGISRTKDFVALNRSLSGRAQPKISPNAYKPTVDTEGRFCSRREDSVSQLRSPARKKRTVGLNGQAEKSMFVNSLPMKQRNIKDNGVGGKELHFVDRSCIRERSSSPRRGSRAVGSKDHGVVSFTFNSPLKNQNPICTEPKDSMNEMDNKHSYQKRLLVDGNDGESAVQNQFSLRGHALGVLLEQKLKELTSQEADELMHDSNFSKKSTAMILQELLLALTSEQPISPGGHSFNAHRPFEADGKRGGNDSDHLSPGSVLEASFSNDSCFSSSLDDSTRYRQLPDCIDYSFDRPQHLETEVDLWDSVSCANGGRFCSMIVPEILNHVSRKLQSINLARGALTGSKLSHAKYVILIAELLFGNSSAGISDRMNNFLIGPFLLDGLEILAGAIWPNFNSLLGFEETKESNRLRRFLFDCVTEFLDSKYSRYSNSGFKAWRRVPKSMNSKMLIDEVAEEVRMWMSLAGMIPDEIIEWEMSHCLGKWTDFEIEAFEAAAEIGCDILQRLVEEVVMDFGDIKLTF